MLGIIAAKEIREFKRDGRLVWAGGLMVVLMIAAILTGWQQQRTVQAERNAGQALDYDAWLKQGWRHPHNAADQGMHVFKPDPPLSVIDPGIDPFVGSTIWLRSHRQSETKFRPAQDATGLKRFGNLSPAWLLQVLGPLLVIILGFSAFSGEREQGTLRQLLSLGVSTRRLLWGKALALTGALGLLLLPAALLASMAVLSNLGSQNVLDVAARLALLGSAYGLYLGGAVFFVLGVSALCRTARASLFLLLALWIACVLIAPRAIADFANRAYPAPSRLAFESGLTKDLGTAATKVWKANFGVSTQWDASVPLNKWGKALQVDDRAGYGVLDRDFGSLWDTFERQQHLQELVGIIAPVVSLRSFSMAAAGTDFSHHRDFSESAEKQRRRIQEVVSDDLVKHADPLGNQHFSYKAGPAVWAKVPRFNYRAPYAAFALRRHGISLAMLAIVFAISILFARFAVTRRPNF
ncbi:MAG: ABC transporter permease subunit [Novosphingobium sp.]